MACEDSADVDSDCVGIYVLDALSSSGLEMVDCAIEEEGVEYGF
jgi:hypothetical protein